MYTIYPFNLKGVIPLLFNKTSYNIASLFVVFARLVAKRTQHTTAQRSGLLEGSRAGCSRSLSLSLALLGGWICLVKCCGMRNSHGRVFSSVWCHPPMEQQNGPKDGRRLSLNWLSIVRHPHYDDNKDDGPARCNFPSKRPKIDCRTSQTALLAGCLVLVGKNPSYSSCGAREREEQSLLRFFHRKTNAGTSAGHTLYTCFNSFLYVVNLPLSFPVRRSLDEWSMLACLDGWRSNPCRPEPPERNLFIWNR